MLDLMMNRFSLNCIIIDSLIEMVRRILVPSDHVLLQR